ncbi:MAG: YlbF family regulator [Bacilli bacterium]|nr:YlbF family regulator [Bacilli bacterium]
MDEIMDKTFKLIDVLDNSDVIKNITLYKNKVISNTEIQELINIGNKTMDKYKLMDIKRKLYKYEDYVNYMKYYNELMYIVMDINSRFKSITGNKCF